MMLGEHYTTTHSDYRDIRDCHSVPDFNWMEAPDSWLASVSWCLAYTMRQPIYITAIFRTAMHRLISVEWKLQTLTALGAMMLGAHYATTHRYYCDIQDCHSMSDFSWMEAPDSDWPRCHDAWWTLCDNPQILLRYSGLSFTVWFQLNEASYFWGASSPSGFDEDNLFSFVLWVNNFESTVMGSVYLRSWDTSGSVVNTLSSCLLN